MIYKVEIIEKLKSVVEVKARSLNEALSKAERCYLNDKQENWELDNVEFVAIVDKNKKVKKEVK